MELRGFERVLCMTAHVDINYAECAKIYYFSDVSYSSLLHYCLLEFPEAALFTCSKLATQVNKRQRQYMLHSFNNGT